MKKNPGAGIFGISLIFMILVACIYSLFSCSSKLTVDNSAIKSLDFKRFLGKWYEIARFDHRFERGLQMCSANYAITEDGGLRVTNRGIKNGLWKTSIGKGKFTKEPGVLKVSFFWPFYSDYRILMLASDYSYALIGGSNDKYLWILSRTPQIAEQTRDEIIREAESRGYDTDKLIWVEQSE